MMALTPKQEKFAQCVASGMTQAEAYREAYDAQNMKDATIWSRASELMTDGKVTARVAELREPIVKEAQMTLKSHLEDLQKLRNMAVKAEQYSAAITAEIARGKAAGIHIERSDVRVSGGLVLIPAKQ
jgi:phage terminase small subunit